jgi:inner membrane transporter RhtA
MAALDSFFHPATMKWHSPEEESGRQLQSVKTLSANVFRSYIRLPAWALVLIAVISVQYGAGVAKGLFDVAGPTGVVFLRTFITGIVFYVLWRPRIRGYTRSDYLYLVLFGINIAVMMLTFYAAIDLIPLGVAVATAFAGPLGVAVLGSRRLGDFLWVVVAGIGILLLSPFSNTSLDPLGMGLSLLSALSWATYIYLNKRISKAFPVSTALSFGMTIAALVVLPIGAAGAVRVLTDPTLLAVALVVALFSSAIPFALEYQALKMMPPRAFGLLVSIEPVAAAVMGFLVLREALGPLEMVGVALVTAAAVATARSSSG